MIRSQRSLPALLFLLFLPMLVFAHEGLHEQIAEVTKHIERNPKNADLYIQRGELYRENREWKLALADYKRAAKLDPELAVVDLCKGRLYLDQGLPELAKEPLDRFLQSKPDHPEALQVRARVLVQLGKPLEAVQDFSHALNTDARPELYLERAQAMGSEGQEHAGEALAGLDEGIRNLGPIVTLELAAVDLELAAGRYDSALQRLEAVANQSERKESWLFRRGEILEKAGRIEEARKAYSDAITAIDSLPDRARNTRTTEQLKAHIQERIAALKED